MGSYLSYALHLQSSLPCGTRPVRSAVSIPILFPHFGDCMLTKNLLAIAPSCAGGETRPIRSTPQIAQPRSRTRTRSGRMLSAYPGFANLPYPTLLAPNGTMVEHTSDLFAPFRVSYAPKRNIVCERTGKLVFAKRLAGLGRGCSGACPEAPQGSRNEINSFAVSSGRSSTRKCPAGSARPRTSEAYSRQTAGTS